jgi:hypothetical protein
MAIIRAKQEEDNNVKQNKDTTNGKPNNVSPEPLRLSCNYTTVMSDALYAQLDRFCEAHQTTPIHKRNDPTATPQPMAKSKVIRRAVYEAMREPSKVADKAKPFRASQILNPPERTHSVSWTMPQNKPQDADLLRLLWPTYGGNQSTFVRRAIFVYTDAYRSPDRDTDNEAASDAWC